MNHISVLRSPNIALLPVLLVLLVALVDDDVEVGDGLDYIGDLVDDEVEVVDGPGEEQHWEDDLSHLGGIASGSKLFSRKNHQLQSLRPGGASPLSQELETAASSLCEEATL